MFNSDTQPLCRYCGKGIAKHIRFVWIEHEAKPHHKANTHWRHVVAPEGLRTKADCQPHTNGTVVSVQRAMNPEFIRSFGEWDGQSWKDQFFCNGSHAQRFAYFAASQGGMRFMPKDYVDASNARASTKQVV